MFSFEQCLPIITMDVLTLFSQIPHSNILPLRDANYWPSHHMKLAMLNSCKNRIIVNKRHVNLVKPELLKCTSVLLY